MKKISMLLVFLLFAGLQVVLAQTTVTGTVKGSSDNLPLAGVTVLVKGTAIGTATGIDGKFSIQVPNNQAILQFSFIGFTTQEVLLGTQTVVNITLAEALTQMNEVVVTALGIKRESKSLGYAATSVNTEQMVTSSTNSNFARALVGKVAGVNITSPTSGPGGSAKIRIRGQSSFGGYNQPLLVVNGVPISNSSRVEASDADFGDGLQSINPDDIESMTVLKGASAAALYGYRAKDGVIIITTKTGAGKRGLGIEINSSFVADQALDYTNWQYEYGQGEYGIRPGTMKLADGSIVPSANPLSDARSSGVWSFGTKIDNQPFLAYDNQEHPYSAFTMKERFKAFYNTATNFTNSVAISSGGENGSMRVSFANTDAKGIIERNNFKKKIVDLNMNYNLSKNLTATVSVNYSNEFNQNPPLSTQDLSISNSVWTMANTTDPGWLKNPYKDPLTGNEISYCRFTNRTNPYWVIYERTEQVYKDRIYGNSSMRWQVTPWLFAQARAGMDWNAQSHNVNGATGTAATPAAASGFNGSFTKDFSKSREINLDFLIGANKKFGKFGVDATVGGNRMAQKYESLSTSVTNFYIRGLYTIGNGQTKSPGQGYSEKKVNSLYGTLDLSWNDYFFVNVTGRNDWFSTLNPKSNSYLYPSVSASFLFSQAFKGIMPSWMDYGKVRVAYAEVGGDTSPYTNTLYYSMSTNQFDGTYPYGNISGSTNPNPNLKPLKVKETELGLELIFLDRRISLDMAVYRKNTVDEILNVDISNTSGFSSNKVNVGKLRNQGIETLLTLVPVRNQNFSWEVGFNYTYNQSEVLQLAGGQPRLDVSGATPWIGQISHEVGMPLGSVRGNDYTRDDKGNIITVNGRFSANTTMKTFGSAVPKYWGGFLNTFTYKAFRLFAQIDFKGGNVIMSNSEYNFLRAGHSKASLVGREGGVIFPGVNTDGTANATAVEAELFYSDYSGKRVHTPFVTDGSFIRWRALSLGVDLTRFVNKTFIKGLSVNGNINNVLLISSKMLNLDPECVSNISDSDMGIEKCGIPTTRSYGISLNIKF
jgi:TonB-linked SusC/RagA family outer membrane protein